MTWKLISPAYPSNINNLQLKYYPGLEDGLDYQNYQNGIEYDPSIYTVLFYLKKANTYSVVER